MKRSCVLLASLLATTLAWADVAVFTNMSGDGNWHNPANWSTNRVPGVNDHVVIPEGKRCLFSGAAISWTITVQGELHALQGGSFFTTEFKVSKGAEVLTGKTLRIDGVGVLVSKVTVQNEGTIQGTTKEANLTIGPCFIPELSPEEVVFNNVGGSVKDIDWFVFRGHEFNMEGGFLRVGMLGVNTDLFKMHNGSSILSLFYSESSYLTTGVRIRAANFEIGPDCRITTGNTPTDGLYYAGDIVIAADQFLNKGGLFPGLGTLQNGRLKIQGQKVTNNGSMGNQSGLGKASLAHNFNSVTLRADTVLIERVDGMITADTLRVYGRQIIVKIQNGVGIGLMTGVDFYTTVDGTIDFTQTTYFNAIAGGYIKRIFSNHVIPSEQWRLQSVFGGPVSVFPADATLLQASATLAPSFGYAGTRDTLQLYLQNQSMTAVRLAYTVSSNLGWAPALNDSTTQLAPFASVAIAIPFAIPPGTSRGTADTVKVTVTIGRLVVAKASAAISCLSRSSEPWTVSQVVVKPDQVNLVVGQQQQFTAVGMNADGDTLYFEPEWSATGGTIDSTGLYTATQAGDFSVTCTDKLSGASASAAVHVGATEVCSESAMAPQEFELRQNYPNPFNPVTTIAYEVKERCRVILKIVDVRGKAVALLVDQMQQPGLYTVRFDARELASGIYFYQIQMAAFNAVKKMVVVK
ncbi:MAG: T9SS type A sorting domain-containing protein [candidate division KSB1 bacterium]|nr:T9SS type A sorting domain-containing protein [candidate division KSB1 bacterium]